MCRQRIIDALDAAGIGQRYDRDADREGPPYYIVDNADPYIGETGRLTRSRYEVLVAASPDGAEDAFNAAYNALLSEALVLIEEAELPALRDLFGGDVDQEGIPTAVATFVVRCP